MTDADDCSFCAIVAEDAPASVVHETDETLAFLDIAPVTEGHTLVIPKAHSAGLDRLDPETGGRLFQVGQQVAAALRASDVPTDGINFFLADGEPAGQEVFHVHLHVIPRTEDDSVRLSFERSYPKREQLDAVAIDVADEL